MSTFIMPTLFLLLFIVFNIGANVNLEGLGDGSIKVEWIPHEGVVKVEDQEGSRGSTNGWIELVVIEARDLIAADLRGTSDPYVRVNYGNSKKRTKVRIFLLRMCVEYQRLPPNQMSDKWIPLQGVKSGEIHIQITRKVPEMQTRHTLDSHPSSLSKSHQIPTRER
ncbi:hypothetical protein JHK87_009936 [Glycine soja]|nr:hypothetical protein JHK87_009936 [Glycine soja]